MVFFRHCTPWRRSNERTLATIRQRAPDKELASAGSRLGVLIVRESPGDAFLLEEQSGAVLDRVGPSHAAIAHHAMSGSRLEVFGGAGHFPHHSDPDRFVAVLREFLAGTDPAGYDVGRWCRLLRSGGRPRIADDGRLELPPISSGA